MKIRRSFDEVRSPWGTKQASSRYHIRYAPGDGELLLNLFGKCLASQPRRDLELAGLYPATNPPIQKVPLCGAEWIVKVPLTGVALTAYRVRKAKKKKLAALSRACDSARLRLCEGVLDQIVAEPQAFCPKLDAVVSAVVGDSRKSLVLQ
jgi:hypothetical protein